jgi:hypothetical protein
MRYAIALLFIAGCTFAPEKQYGWVNSAGSNNDQLQRDFGQCETQALSVTGVSTQRGVSIFGACMRGKGWTLVER